MEGKVQGKKKVTLNKVKRGNQIVKKRWHLRHCVNLLRIRPLNNKLYGDVEEG